MALDATTYVFCDPPPPSCGWEWARANVSTAGHRQGLDGIPRSSSSGSLAAYSSSENLESLSEGLSSRLSETDIPEMIKAKSLVTPQLHQEPFSCEVESSTVPGGSLALMRHSPEAAAPTARYTQLMETRIQRQEVRGGISELQMSRGIRTYRLIDSRFSFFPVGNSPSGHLMARAASRGCGPCRIGLNVCRAYDGTRASFVLYWGCATGLVEASSCGCHPGLC